MAKYYVHFSSFFGMFLWLIFGFIIWIPVVLVGTSNYIYEAFRTGLNGTDISSDTKVAMRNKIDMYQQGFKNFKLIIKSYSNYHANN